MKDEDFVLLDSFPTPHEAHLAANALRAVEIPVKIVDESAVSVMPHLELALGGVKIFVREQDVEDAARILRGDADLAEQPYREPAEDDALAERAPDDLTEYDPPNPDEDKVSRAFRASIIGLFLCPVVLQAYSVVLLAGVSRDGLSAGAIGRARIAWAINLVVLAAALVVLYRHLAG